MFYGVGTTEALGSAVGAVALGTTAALGSIAGSTEGCSVSLPGSVLVGGGKIKSL